MVTSTNLDVINGNLVVIKFTFGLAKLLYMLALFRLMKRSVQYGHRKRGTRQARVLSAILTNGNSKNETTEKNIREPANKTDYFKR